MVNVVSRLISLLSVVGSATAGDPVCPVRPKPTGGGVVYDLAFLETSSKQGRSSTSAHSQPPLKPNIAAQVPQEDEDRVPKDFMPDYKPASFTCMSCDVSTCDGNALICDTSSCIGKFYTQECWCQTEQTLKLNQPAWRFRKEKSKFEPNPGIKQFFCDDDCTGGICNMNTLKCARRQEACQPWWWCNEPPPSEPPPQAFLQVEDKAVEKNEAKVKEHSAAKKTDDGTIANTYNDKDTFDFQPGRFECGAAMLPPKVRNPTTYLWEDRGYVVLDRSTCDGSLFEFQCYCWDNFLYLAGKDPMTSDLKCDSTCKWGQCDGKTCGKVPPPPLNQVVAETPPLPEPEVLHNSDNQMIPIG